jgi:hypothetical protein
MRRIALHLIGFVVIIVLFAAYGLCTATAVE